MAQTHDAQERMEEAIRRTAPGTALRNALDMILAGRLGALICIGDTERVLASGNDGFPLNIAFTSNPCSSSPRWTGPSSSTRT